MLTSSGAAVAGRSWTGFPTNPSFAGGPGTPLGATRRKRRSGARATARDRREDGYGVDPDRGARPKPPTLEFLGPPCHEGDLGTLGPYRVLELLGHGGMGGCSGGATTCWTGWWL